MVYFAFAKRITRRGRIGERRRTSNPLKKEKNREKNAVLLCEGVWMLRSHGAARRVLRCHCYRTSDSSDLLAISFSLLQIPLSAEAL